MNRVSPEKQSSPAASINKTEQFDSRSASVGVGPLPLAKRNLGEFIGKPVELLRRIFSSTPTSKISVGNAFTEGKLDDHFGYHMRMLSKHTSGKSNGTLEDFHRSQLYQYQKDGSFIEMRNAVEDYKSQIEDLISDLEDFGESDRRLGGGKSKAFDKGLAGYKEKLRGVNIWLRSADTTVASQLFDGTPSRDLVSKVTVGQYLAVLDKNHPHHAQLEEVDKDTPLTEAKKGGLDVAKVDLMHAMSADALKEHAEGKGLGALLSERIKNAGEEAPAKPDAARGLQGKEAFSGIKLGTLKIRGKSLDIGKHPEQVRGWLQAIGRKDTGVREGDIYKDKAARALLKAAPGKAGYTQQLAFRKALVAHEESLNKHIAALKSIRGKESGLGGLPSASLTRVIKGLEAECRGIEVLRAAQDNIATASILSSNSGKVALNTTLLEDINLEKSFNGTKPNSLNRLLIRGRKYLGDDASLGALLKQGTLLPMYALKMVPKEKRDSLLADNPSAAKIIRCRAKAESPPSVPVVKELNDGPEVVAPKSSVIPLAKENNVPIGVDGLLVEEELQAQNPIPIEVDLPENLEEDLDPEVELVRHSLPSLETMHARKAEAAAVSLKKEGAYANISEADLKTIADAYVEAENIAVALTGPKEIQTLALDALQKINNGQDPEDVLEAFSSSTGTVFSEYNDKALIAAYGPGMAPFLKDIPEEDKEMVGNSFAEGYLPVEAFNAWLEAGDHTDAVYMQDEVSKDNAIQALTALLSATEALTEEAEVQAGVVLTKASSIEQALLNKDAVSGPPPPAAPPAPPPPPPPPIAPAAPVGGLGSSIIGGKSSLKKAPPPEKKPQADTSDLLASIRKGISLKDASEAIKKEQEAEPSKMNVGGGSFTVNEKFNRLISGDDDLSNDGDLINDDDDWGDDDWDD